MRALTAGSLAEPPAVCQTMVSESPDCWGRAELSNDDHREQDDQPGGDDDQAVPVAPAGKSSHNSLLVRSRLNTKQMGSVPQGRILTFWE